MSVRIGLALGDDAIRAAVVDGGRIHWIGETPVAEPFDLVTSIASLLREAPRARFRSVSVCAALGPRFSQVKTLHGLPQVGDRKLLESVVRESSGTFFREPVSGLLTTGLRLLGPGSAVAAALDLNTAHAVREACRKVRLDFRCVTSTAVALSRVFTDGPVAWSDGLHQMELHCSDGQLDSVRVKLRSTSGASGHPSAEPDFLEAFGDVPFRFADAVGATLVESDEPLSLAAAAIEERPADVVRRNRLQYALAASGLALLLLSPLASTWAGMRAEASVSEVSPEQWLSVEAALAQLNYTTQALSSLRSFSESRISSAELLASVSQALPMGSVLLDYEATDSRVQMVVLSEDFSAVLAALRDVRGLSGADILGTPSQQIVGAKVMHRVAVRSGSDVEPRKAASGVSQ